MSSYYGATLRTHASGRTMNEVEGNAQRTVIARTLAATDGKKGEAARRLGISVSKLYRLRKELGID